MPRKKYAVATSRPADMETFPRFGPFGQSHGGGFFSTMTSSSGTTISLPLTSSASETAGNKIAAATGTPTPRNQLHFDMDKFLLSESGPRRGWARLILTDRATDVPGQRHGSPH